MTATKLRPSLLRTGHDLASAANQLRILGDLPLPDFAAHLAAAGLAPLRARAIEILQVNLGKRCNQTCQHCHVDAGPDRREVMPDAVVDACLDFLSRHDIPTLDITGGAPELHPRFRELVTRARALGRRVIDRCNLTITRLPNYADLPAFFAAHHVEVVASLPWYRATQTDAQRGDGVFEDSIAALRHLNGLGYGMPDSGLVLNLVTNPAGAFLPAGQAALERDWKRELQRLHGVHFNNLYTITNMPISRYLEYLERNHQLATYMQKLLAAFNPRAVAGVMCRDTLSVGWDGRLYDCDFNQMLDLALPGTILDADLATLATREIRTAAHCYGCTAGAGSSCGGATT
ncbi:MAG TPA: arsenosugar biosynthesis radical SAM (seleno)protein ArsS [Nannocystis sp.]